MATLMRGYNWAATALGDTKNWPQSLCSAVGICLNSRYPMCVYWGPGYVMLYNDAFSAMLGQWHPSALARPLRELGLENFAAVEQRLAKVYYEGEAVWSGDELFLTGGHGYARERYFNFTFSPIPGEGGAISGVLNTAVETSYRVISERRSRLLRKFVEGTAGALSASNVCSRTVELLASGQQDVPFCLIYKPDWEEGGREARLFAAAGMEAGGPASPAAIPLDDAGASARSWPLRQAAKTGQIEIVDDLSERFGVTLPGGAGPHNARSAAIIPIRLAADKEIADAFLIMGLNPRQEFDEAYRSFAELVAGTLKGAICRGNAYDDERKRAEEHRAAVDFAMNLVHEAVYLVDNDARILYVNDEATRSLGYTREELLHMRVPDIDPDYPPGRWAQYLRDVSAAGSAALESRHKTKDGRIFPVEVNTNYFEYDGKHFNIGLVRDISEGKRAEEERRRAAEQRVMLECAMDRIHEGAFLIGAGGRFLYVNGEACRALRYAREELLGLSVRDIDPDLPPVSWETYLREYSTGPSRTFETRHRTKDGRIFPVEITSGTFTYGGVDYRMALVRDISERKRAAERRVMLEFAMDRVQEGAFLIDNDGHFLYVNGEACRALGYAREELLRMGVPDIDPDFPQERWDQVFRGQLASGTLETRHKSKDGRIYPVEVKANFFQYEGNNYCLALVSGIFERKRQEEQRAAHLRFFETMDRVNRAIQRAAGLEQMMESVLDVALAAFDCDRAWLVCPYERCVQMERTKPEYPGAFALKLEIPMDAGSFSAILAAGGPVQFQKNEGWLASDLAKRIGVKSQLSMAIQPKVGKPCLFGLHQCSAKRIWTPDEERLFQEIGRRISDSLSSLLSYRDLREKEQKYREIFDNASDALTLYHVTNGGRFLLSDMNPCAERIMGLSKSQAAGQFFEDTVSKAIAAHCLPLFRECAGTAKPLTYDEDLDLPAGAYSLQTTLLPVRNEAGQVYRLIVINRDITARKAYEKHLHLLMREVNHRAKNLLAVVQAVVRQTAGEQDPGLFEKRLNERIAGLAASHDLLAKNEFRGVDTRSLVAAQLAHFKDLIGSRAVLDGPPALLKPEAAQALGMALHELATNAGKYGALSCRQGTIRVEWEIAANGQGPLFKIRWIERNGPPPEQPKRQGFGQKVMVQMAEYALEGKVSLSYPSSGLVWELTAPAVRVSENDRPSAPFLPIRDNRPDAAGG
ncbi:MAG: PAS domain S-box protein [Rhodomicrobium sp.]